MRVAEPNPFSAPATVEGRSPRAVRRRDPSEFTTPFRLFAWLLGGGAVALLAGIAFILVTVGIDGQKQRTTEEMASIAPAIMVGGLAYLAGGAAMVAAIVFQMILTYRAWEIVQDGAQRTTPGKAVGFMFIPLFNFYWFFVAKYGLAKDLNRFIETHGIEARRASPGLGLACAIMMLLSAIPLIGLYALIPALVILVIFLKQIANTAAEIVQFQADQADGAIS